MYKELYKNNLLEFNFPDAGNFYMIPVNQVIYAIMVHYSILC